MTNKIIDITKWLGKQEDDWAEKAMGILESLNPEKADLIIRFIYKHILLEVQTGLGLNALPEGTEEPGLIFYQEIDELYCEASRGCYFCDKTIDANEVEINGNTPVCGYCQLKAANLLTAYGINPMGLFALVLKPRTMQKARFKEEK